MGPRGEAIEPVIDAIQCKWQLMTAKVLVLTHTHTDRQTDRHTDRQTNRQTDDRARRQARSSMELRHLIYKTEI